MGEASDIEALLKAHAIQDRNKTPKKSPVEYAKSHLGMVKDVAYIIGGVVMVVIWFQTRASREEVEQAKKDCIATASSAIATALAPIPPRLKALEHRQARDDQRWDGLDTWHVQAFGSKKVTPPPKFGPAAEKRGEVRYYDTDDVQNELGKP